MAVSKAANCKCPSGGRNLVVCIDGTSNQFGDKNTNVVELYSKIEKMQDSNQLTYYNSGIGTYAKPSWKSVKYLLQVVDNSVDLAIAWNFEKIIIGAYRWLADNYEENDRIFLFGFSRGAYQVRALAGMIARVGLIYKGNEEQIPFAYEVYATHTENFATNLATNFKSTFSRANVQVHFVGVWDTVSSVGVIRGKSLPLTNSAEHICFFRHALALDERRVKFLPEYVHGGVCEKSSVSEQPAQIQEVGLDTFPRIKEVWFPGTHSDIGGGTRLNPNLDLGRTPLLWMSFEAVSCGLKLRNTQVEWRWDHLYDMKESLTGVWRVFEWLPFKRLSYKDESSTVYRFHRGRGRKIKSGQKIHSSIAFCDDSYHPKAILSQQNCVCELVGKGSLSNREWVKGWEDLIEMDIFDLSLLPKVIEKLVSGTESESSIWVYRLTAITSTDEGRTALRNRPNIINDLVQIFAHPNQPDAQKCVIAILEKTSEGHASAFLSSEHRIWLLRVSQELEHRHSSFAVKLLAYSLSQDQSYEDIFNENALGTLDEMSRDEQRPWVTNGAFAMFTSILSQKTLSQKLFSANTMSTVRKRFTAEDSVSRDVAKRLFGVILLGVQNRQHLFDNDILQSFLRMTDSLDSSERLFIKSFLVNQYEYLPHEFFMLLTTKLCDNINRRRGYNTLLFLGDTIDHGGLRMRIWTSKIGEALREAFSQVGTSERLLGLQLFRTLTIYESLRDEVFDANTVKDLGRALYDSNDGIRSNTVKFFKSTIAESFRDKIFNTEIVTELGRAVVHEDFLVRYSAVKIFIAALAHDRLWDNIDTISALRCALGNEHDNGRSEMVEFFSAALAYDSLWDRIFDTETISTLERALSDEDYEVRSNVVNFFSAALAHDGLWAKIFDIETISTLSRALSDEDYKVRSNVVEFFSAALAHDRLWAKIFDTETISTLSRALIDEDSNARSNVIKFFSAALVHDGLWDRIFDTETISTLQHALSDTDYVVRSIVVEFFSAALAHEGLWAKIFDPETISTLSRALSDKDYIVRSNVVKFFSAALVHDGLWAKIFDPETILTISHAQIDEDYNSRSYVVKFFIAALAHDGLWDKIFDTETISALRYALSNGNSDVRSGMIPFFSAVLPHDGLWDKIFDTETIATLGRALSDKYNIVRSDAFKFFSTALVYDILWDKIFDTEAFSALGHAISDKDYDFSPSAEQFFTAAMAHEGIRDKLFNDENVSVLVNALNNEHSNIRNRAVTFFTVAISQEGFRNKIFSDETIAALRRALDSSSDTSNIVKFFTVAMTLEGFRGKIFSDETIAALRRALEHDSSSVTSNIVKFFTVAMAQEGFRDKIFSDETIAALMRALEHDVTTSGIVEYFTAALAQEDLRERIFNTRTIPALVNALGCGNRDAIRSAVNFFTNAIAHANFRDEILNNGIITALMDVLVDSYDDVRESAVIFFTTATAHEGFRDKIFGGDTIPILLKRIPDVKFWSHDYLLTRAYNHFITTTLCEQLISTDLSLRAQTYYFISKAIECEDVRARIYTAELKEKMEKHETDMQVLPDAIEVTHAA